MSSSIRPQTKELLLTSEHSNPTCADISVRFATTCKGVQKRGWIYRFEDPIGAPPATPPKVSSISEGMLGPSRPERSKGEEN